MDLEKCRFPIILHHEGGYEKKIMNIQEIIKIIKELPLNFNDDPELAIYGTPSSIIISPYHSNFKIERFKVVDNKEVFFESVSNDYYCLRYNKISIEIKKINDEGKLKEKISELENKVKILQS